MSLYNQTNRLFLLFWNCLCSENTTPLGYVLDYSQSATGEKMNNNCKISVIQSYRSIISVKKVELTRSQSASRRAGLIPWCQSLFLSATITFQSRMATAVCGLQSAGSKPAKLHREHRRKAKDSRRRQAALLFLTNISLDGRPPCQVGNGNTDQKAGEDPRLRDGDGGATVVPLPAVSQRLVSQVTEPSAAGSDSSLQGVVSPYRPSLVMSPGPAGTNAVGANDVFLESCSLSETLTPDTPQSPVPAGHQPCSRVRSTPVALSPVPAVTTVDSRQR